MGYDISLEKNGETAKLNKPVELKGSVYAVGGSSEASYSITFNYSGFYKDAFKDPEGIGCLNGLSYDEGLAKIARAISKLSDENLPPTIEELRQEEAQCIAELKARKEGDFLFDYLKSKIQKIRRRIAEANPDSDRVRPSYWDATPYNAKIALRNLLKMAAEAPSDTIWVVDK